MIEAFIEYEERRAQLATHVDPNADHSVVGVPLGTRLQRIIRLDNGWRLWLATNDFKHGTYLDIHNNGMIVRVTVRADEGDECFVVRPSDDHIRPSE